MTTDEQTTTDTEDKDKGPSSEAARYRTRLRAVESERDALASRVAAFTRADVVRHVSERLVDADDLFIVGQVDVADLVDEEGAVDIAACDAAVDSLLQRRPRLGKGWEPDVEGGLDGGARTSVQRSGASWGSLLSGATAGQRR